MKKIENKTRVVVDESVVEQILALEPESVVLIQTRGLILQGFLSTVLHRTGDDGWLVTRPIDVARSRSGSEYIKNAQIEAYLRRAENAGAEFYLLYAPSVEEA